MQTRITLLQYSLLHTYGWLQDMTCDQVLIQMEVPWDLNAPVLWHGTPAVSGRAPGLCAWPAALDFAAPPSQLQLPPASRSTPPTSALPAPPALPQTIITMSSVWYCFFDYQMHSTWAPLSEVWLLDKSHIYSMQSNLQSVLLPCVSITVLMQVRAKGVCRVCTCWRARSMAASTLAAA